MPKSPTLSLRIYSANIQNTPDLPDAQVREDVRTVSKVADLVGWQEIGEMEDMQAISVECGSGWVHAQLRAGVGGTPVSARATKLTLLRAKSYLASNRTTIGRKVGPRFITRAVYASSHSLSLPKIVVYNTHFVPGAWNKEVEAGDPQRQDLWNGHYALLRELVLADRLKGRLVFFMGDFNRMEVEPFHKDQAWLVERGIDKIGVVPPNGFRVKTHGFDPKSLSLNSDHNAVGGLVTLSLEPKSKIKISKLKS